MKDEYKKAEFARMQAEADLQLSCQCPLVEDEAIVWAGRRINELERLLCECHKRFVHYDHHIAAHDQKTFLSQLSTAIGEV